MTGTREQLLTGLRERILAYAASRVGRDFAEDLAQEVLLVLETKYGHLESVEDLVPVSFQILRFKMQDLRRKLPLPAALRKLGKALNDEHSTSSSHQ